MALRAGSAPCLARRACPGAARPRLAPLRVPTAAPGLAGAQQRGALLPRRAQQVDAAAAPSADAMAAQLAALQAENERLKAELSALRDNAVTVGPAPGAAAAAAPAGAPAKAAVGTDAFLRQLELGVAWPARGSKFWESPARGAPMPVDVGAGASSVQPRDSRSLDIVHFTAELAPIAKVGGLGDVVHGLARTCLARGHNVAVLMPFYECLPQAQIEGLAHEMDIDVPKGRSWDGEFQIGSLRTSVWRGVIGGVPVVLLRPADWDSCNLFRGGRIYGGSYNEMESYLYFCRAGLEYLRASGQQPHVMHLHEWQTAAVSMLYWEVYSQLGLYRPRVVLTIHNLDNTGECRQDEFSFTGVDGELFATIDRALDERTIGHNPERLNLMKGGLVYSNAVTTVSPTYANEVLNGGQAGWLRSTLTRPEVKAKVRGILNGIDVEEWDPARDGLLAANFTAQFPDGKAVCKKFLQRGLGLDESADKPLVAVITRLVPQKGIHLIKAALFKCLDRGAQFVLLGSGHCDGEFKKMAEAEFKDHRDVRLMVMYSEALAHQIYAAADIILVPSMFEPCGLTQMIGMRYGAVPVVRKTGGLADTVRDVDSHANGEGNGYTFDGSDEAALFGALDRALSHFRDRRDAWGTLAQTNMNTELSWSRSAADYRSEQGPAGPAGGDGSPPGAEQGEGHPASPPWPAAGPGALPQLSAIRTGRATADSVVGPDVRETPRLVVDRLKVTAPGTQPPGAGHPAEVAASRPAGPHHSRSPPLRHTTRDQLRGAHSPQGNVFVNQYLIIRDLGRGAHGTVKLALDTEDHTVYAMKVVHRKAAHRRRNSYSVGTPGTPATPLTDRGSPLPGGGGTPGGSGAGLARGHSMSADALAMAGHAAGLAASPFAGGGQCAPLVSSSLSGSGGGQAELLPVQRGVQLPRAAAGAAQPPAAPPPPPPPDSAADDLSASATCVVRAGASPLGLKAKLLDISAAAPPADEAPSSPRAATAVPPPPASWRGGAPDSPPLSPRRGVSPLMQLSLKASAAAAAAGGGGGAATLPRAGSGLLGLERSPSPGLAALGGGGGDAQLGELAREMAVMRRLDHPHVVALHEARRCALRRAAGRRPARPPLRLTPPCLAGQVIHDPEAALLVLVMEELVSGLDYLHSNLIVHGDLKPDNLLLSAEGRLKISDFGSAALLASPDALVAGSRGTPAFTAPEMCGLRPGPHAPFPAECWALGVCLHMFIYGRVPYVAASPALVYEAIRSPAPLALPPTPAVSDALAALLRGLLDKRPERRTMLAEVCGHEWVTDGGREPPLPRWAEQAAAAGGGGFSPVGAGLSRAEAAAAVTGLKRQVKAACPDVEERTYRRGAVLVAQGALPEGLFLILRGRCELVLQHTLAEPPSGGSCDAGVAGSGPSFALAGAPPRKESDPDFAAQLSDSSDGSADWDADEDEDGDGGASGGGELAEAHGSYSPLSGSLSSAWFAATGGARGGDRGAAPAAELLLPSPRWADADGSAAAWGGGSDGDGNALAPAASGGSQSCPLPRTASVSAGPVLVGGAVAPGATAEQSWARAEAGEPSGHSTSGLGEACSAAGRRHGRARSVDLSYAGAALHAGAGGLRRAPSLKVPDTARLAQLAVALPPRPGTAGSCGRGAASPPPLSYGSLAQASAPDLRGAVGLPGGLLVQRSASSATMGRVLNRAMRRSESMHRRMKALVVQAKLLTQHNSKRQELVGTRGPGQVVGDTSLGSRAAPAAATVRAASRMRVLLVRRANADALRHAPCVKAALWRSQTESSVLAALESFASYDQEVAAIDDLRQSLAAASSSFSAAAALTAIAAGAGGGQAPGHFSALGALRPASRTSSFTAAAAAAALAAAAAPPPGGGSPSGRHSPTGGWAGAGGGGGAPLPSRGSSSTRFALSAAASGSVPASPLPSSGALGGGGGGGGGGSPGPGSQQPLQRSLRHLRL
ncbi:SS4 [Scenedesmus sp. PABB004]|nr:SS4 [Scenedesmus sp. PABB004]